MSYSPSDILHLCCKLLTTLVVSYFIINTSCFLFCFKFLCNNKFSSSYLWAFKELCMCFFMNFTWCFISCFVLSFIRIWIPSRCSNAFNQINFQLFSCFGFFVLFSCFESLFFVVFLVRDAHKRRKKCGVHRLNVLASNTRE